jgi:hypothetical protein
MDYSGRTKVGRDHYIRPLFPPAELNSDVSWEVPFDLRLNEILIHPECDFTATIDVILPETPLSPLSGEQTGVLTISPNNLPDFTSSQGIGCFVDGAILKAGNYVVLGGFSGAAWSVCAFADGLIWVLSPSGLSLELYHIYPNRSTDPSATTEVRLFL